MGGILGNRILLTAIVADATAQALKAVVYLLIERKWCPERLFGSGGMPSSHSALVSALAAGVGIREGFGSTLFAVSAVFALVVMYDATGVRRSAGRQAHVLNDLILRLGHVLEEGFEHRALKTFLGHSYPQVLAGLLLGIAAAWISLG
ncbi:MAG: divergent PAP2 family protein [Candidatus Fermentibacteraceae bacterium]